MCGLAGPAPPAGALSCPPLPTVTVTGETRSRAALRFVRLTGEVAEEVTGEVAVPAEALGARGP